MPQIKKICRRILEICLNSIQGKIFGNGNYIQSQYRSTSLNCNLIRKNSGHIVGKKFSATYLSGENNIEY